VPEANNSRTAYKSVSLFVLDSLEVKANTSCEAQFWDSGFMVVEYSANAMGSSA
jgi:hypothetical protein